MVGFYEQPVTRITGMGLIFDIRSCRLYESWYQSPRGRAMDHFIERFIPEIIEPQPYERVLDIGCGTGNHLLLFSKLGLDISGLDASPYMIDMAKKRLGNRCTLKTGMAEDLPFDDNEFDLVILINSLEFLDDPVQALKEAGRVAKRKVFITVTNAFSLSYTYDRVRTLFRETIHQYMKSYNLWGLKSKVQEAYGPVPIEWRCEQSWASYQRDSSGSSPHMRGLRGWPFGSFLGLAATMRYRLKTDNLPLKLRINKREESAASGITSMRNRESAPPVDVVL